MNILFLSDDFPPHSYGGAGIIAFNDAKELVLRGHAVTVVTTTTKKEEVGSKYIEGISVKVIYSKYDERFRHYKNINNRPVVKRIAQIIDELKPDIIHAHNIHTHISYKSLHVACAKVPRVFLTAHDAMLVHYGKARLLNGNLGISQKMLFRDFGLRYNPLKRFFIKKYIKNVTQIFAVSNALKELLQANGIKKVDVLYNGINSKMWEVNDSEVNTFIQEHHLEGKKVILFGGRLSALKGGDVMLKAFSLIYKKIPEARLLIVGKTNPYFERVISTIDDSKKGIIQLGWIQREDMKKIYNASHVITVPSLYLDPFPTVNLEAMAAARPVVGTCFGGTPEAVVDNITGYIVNPEKIEEFAEKIISLLVDNEKADMFGKAGNERVKSVFNIEKHIDELLSCYTNKSK